VTFDLIVQSDNDAPILTVPLSDRYVLEDEEFSITLQDAFEDPDGDDLTLTSTLADGSALPGWIMFDAVEGRFLGTPPENYYGSIEILVTASDGEFSVSNSFDFTVVNVNDAPTLLNPLADVIVEEDTPIQIEIPLNTFEDVDGDELSFGASLSNGQALPEWLTVENGVLTGLPPQNFTGELEITIVASDGIRTAEDDFTITFTPVDDAPIANDDYGFIANAGGTLVINPEEILANDIDPDGDTLTIVDVDQGLSGSTYIDNDGDIVYTPNDSFFGFDTVAYSVTDGVTEASAVINIYVQDNFLEFDVQGTSGNDLIFGDLFSRNSIYGADGNDFIIGGFRQDNLAGGAGNDILFGLSGRDNLFGGSGNDILFGGSGRDTLSGGTGDDILFGGRGRDTFEFAQGDGADIIADFNPGGARRRFYIAGDEISVNYDGIDSFGDLLNIAYQDGGNTVFDFGNGDMLILQATRLASLDEDAFTFT